MSDKARQILCITLIVAVSALSNVFPLDRWLNSGRSALTGLARGAGLTPEAPPPPSDTEARLDFTLRHINTLRIAELKATLATLEFQGEKLPPRVANFKQMLFDIISHKQKKRDPLGTYPSAAETPPPEDSSTPPPPEPDPYSEQE